MKNNAPALVLSAHGMTASPNSLKYRPDIDGMRALAVIPVCIFHAGLPGFPGGFCGVDVFFVISGYLMARLIEQDLLAGRFSVSQFYARRARRILPALFVLLLICSVVAALIIPPKLFRDFGATLLGAVLFASNIVFWRKSANYFDANTDRSPLLHTWSLGVEEQFYILFPLFMLLLWTLKPRFRPSAVIALLIASLILSIWGTLNAPTATFYLLPTRAWELLAGALVALRAMTSEIGTEPRRFGNTGGLTGLALVLSGFLFFSSEMPFPGATALAPCVGTAMLLHFGGGATLASRVLSLRPLRFVGFVSYSLYLWHWPVLVFAGKYLSSGTLAPSKRVGLLLASFAIACASWRWVERPFRSVHTGWNTTRVFAVAAAGACVLIAFGLFASEGDGWAARFPNIESVSLERQEAIDSQDVAWRKFDDGRCFVARASDWNGDTCFLTHSGTRNVLLWGDSFARSYAYGFFRSGAEALNVLEYTGPQCPPILGYETASRPQCTQFDASVPAIVRRYEISTVIMAANWSSYFNRRKLHYSDMRNTAQQLRKLGVRVIVIGQSPVFPFAYPDEYFYMQFGVKQMDAAYAQVDVDLGMNREIGSIVSEGDFFDPMRLLCRGSECRFKEGAHYLVSDYGHLSPYGSRILVSELINATIR